MERLGLIVRADVCLKGCVQRGQTFPAQVSFERVVEYQIGYCCSLLLSSFFLFFFFPKGGSHLRGEFWHLPIPVRGVFLAVRINR